MFVRIVKGIQAAVVCYTLLAVFYTTKVVLQWPLRIGLSQAGLYLVFNNKTTWPSHAEHSRQHDGSQATSTTGTAPTKSLHIQDASGDLAYWTLFESTVDNKSEHGLAMTEGLFLSKAFSQSMQPNKIVPFFYKATGNFDKEDITITTLITSNRFKVIARLVQEYQGEVLLSFCGRCEYLLNRSRPDISRCPRQEHHEPHPFSPR